MTAGPTSLGGLYISVNLDTSTALRQLQTLNSQIRRMSSGITLPGAGQAGGLNQVATGIDKVAASTRRLGTASSGLSTFRAELTTMAAILAPGRAGTVIYGVGALNRSLGALKSTGATSAMVGFGAAAIGATAAVAALTIGVGKLASAGIEAGARLENLMVSLETLMGAQAAKAEVGFLVELAQVSPFLTDTIIAMDKMLFAQGLVATGLRRGLIKAATDMGAALGLTDENLNSITYALSQVQARGYLSGDELRQLANQFVPVWKMLQELPQFAGMTQSALRKMSEEGKISAQTFFEAFISYTERFEGAAAKQADTLNGLILRFQDFRNAIGFAFLEVERGGTGPLEVLKDALRSVNDTLSEIDWRPFAVGLAQAMDSVVGRFTDGIRNMSEGIVNFFETTLPRIGAAIGKTIELVVDSFNDLGTLFGELAGFFRAAFATIGATVIVVAGVMYVAINGVINVIILLISAIKAAGAFFSALVQLIAGDFVKSAQLWNEGVDALISGATAIGNFARGPYEAIRGGLEVIAAIEGQTIPKFAADADNAAESTDNMTNSVGDLGDAAGGPGGASKKVDELAKAMNELCELTQRFLGQRSELEQGFLGKTGFTSSIDSITRMAKTLIEALTTLGANETAGLIKRTALALIALAEQRERVAERLEAAESKLADALSAREDFRRAIRQQSIDFANALRVESEAVRTFESRSRGGVLFFVETETTKQKSFVEALKERLRAIKDFFTNIKRLRDQGLDQGLLQQLFAAGPEQAGGIVAGLVEGGAATVAQVNALQAQLNTVATQMGDYGAQVFFQAGVDQAQAVVDGLNSELDALEAQAIAMTNVVYAAVLPWAKKLEDEGRKAALGAAGGLASGIPAIDTSMGGIDATIGNHADRWDFMMHGAGGDVTKELGFETGDWLSVIDTFTLDAFDEIDTWIADVTDAFESHEDHR